MTCLKEESHPTPRQLELQNNPMLDYSEVKENPNPSRKTYNAANRQVGGDWYKSFPIQPGTFIYENDLNWFQGNAIKYICRHKVKGGRIDLEKAIHYLELLIDAEYSD